MKEYNNIFDILLNVFSTHNGNPAIEIDEDVAIAGKVSPTHNIIVWNDDVNTFDWVIESLVDICGHTVESAEQCALFIHQNGKYAVKKGDFDTLRPQCEGLIDRGISATID